MTCAVCGSPLPDSPVFPGGRVECVCGAALVVPIAAAAPASPTRPTPAEPYHEALCPRCQAPLELREEDGIVVTACPAHHGLFVARGALQALEHESVATARKLDGVEADATNVPAKLLLCPRCESPMAPRKLQAASVVVDECALHGTWFDAGELRDAMAARALGVPSAPAADPSLLSQRAVANLEEGLARQQGHDEPGAREATEVARELLDSFHSVVLGRTPTR